MSSSHVTPKLWLATAALASAGIAGSAFAQEADASRADTSKKVVTLEVLREPLLGLLKRALPYLESIDVSAMPRAKRAQLDELVLKIEDIITHGLPDEHL